MNINIELIKSLCMISVVISVITCAFTQKTKGMFNKSKYIWIYSLILNLIVGVLFTLSFTEYNYLNGLWVGIFSFIDADTIYKTLEGKIKSLDDINKSKPTIIERKDK